MDQEKLMGYRLWWGRIGGRLHIARVTRMGASAYRNTPLCGGMVGMVYIAVDEGTIFTADATKLDLSSAFSRTPCPRCKARAPRVEVAA